MSQLMVVDAVALTVVTPGDSAERMFDNIVLELGGANHWQLNFPFLAHGLPADRRAREILHRHFAPGATDFFTFDARGVPLGSITQLVLRSEATAFPSSGAWKPSRLVLHINGIEVFSLSMNRSLSPTQSIGFAYPRRA
jgi:hypothetical protein